MTNSLSFPVEPNLPPYNAPGLISQIPPLDTELDAELAPAAAPLDVAAALRGEPLRVLFIASEGVPYIKTGGLADVIGALPKALARLG
ncbi:MAG TPA: glycogen/starch synthase, partial [Gemmatimonadales bacterium]|nr:glycogen/starch synthase [Gemmatimonadales bacterium]